MSGPITVGIGCIAGWKIVQRNEARHVQAIAKDPVVQRTTTYFQENIGRTITAEDLVKVAEDTGAELIVIGLRRRTPVGKLILGSNAQRVLLDAPCPVLAVKADA